MKRIIGLMVAAGVLATGANAQTSASAIRNGSNVLQGDFRAGGSPTFAENNGNSQRVGYGGAAATSRCNQPIWGLDLPSIPAGETLTLATLTAEVEGISGNPLFFDVLASLMTATDVSEFSADPSAYFVAETAAVDSVLANGIVFAQFAQADVPNPGTLQIPVTGAALAQLNSLYDASGNPTQSTVWFRISTSTTNDPAAWQGSDRIQFADGDSTTEAAFGLTLSWGAIPEFVADPVVKANVTWGSDYAALSQTLDGSATSSDGSSTIFYEKTGGPAWLNVASNGALTGIADVVGTNEFPIKAFIGDTVDTAILQIVVDPLGSVPVFGTNVIEKANATFNVDYSDALQTLAGEATDADLDTLIYSRAGGGPGWLNVASNGALSGVCNVLGTNTFPIQVTDGDDNFDFADLVIFVPTIGEAPVFTTNVIVAADATFNGDYSLKAQTLAGSATDADLDTLIYSVEGSGWLNVASNGALSGVATIGGTNEFTVEVTDGNGNTDTATVIIFVAPKPVGELIVGMDTFNSGAAPVVSYTATGISATAAGVGFATGEGGGNTGRGSSKDGTWGNHEGPPAADTVTDASSANLSAFNGAAASMTLTIQNEGAEDIELGSVHFDAVAFRPKASRTYEVSVLDGSGISTGVVFTSASQALVSLGGGLKTDDSDPETHDQHDDIDIFLDGLEDNVLEAGGTAIIQIAFTGGTVGAAGHHLYVDNIGVALAGASGPVIAPVMNIEQSGTDVIISWISESAFKLQSTPQLVPPAWGDVPGATESPVTLPASSNVEFLRLIEQ